MQGNNERQFSVFVCIYAGWNGQLYGFSYGTSWTVFKQQEGNRNWKKCLSDYWSKLPSGCIFTHDTGIFSGNRKRKDKPFSVCYASDPLPDSDLLGFITDWASVYVVCISNLRGNRRSCWDAALPENGYWMEKFRYNKLFHISICYFNRERLYFFLTEYT